MRPRLSALLLTVLLALAGCGGASKPARPHARPALPGYLAACPQAGNGAGRPGICGPRRAQRLLSQHAPPLAAAGGRLFEDLSNNDPCYCGDAIKAKGHSGLIVKANQGRHFTDWTAVLMIGSARAAGLTVGEYDFDAEYTVAEARVFERQLYAAGITPRSTNTFPAYFDVEWGNFSSTGLQAQVNYMRSHGWRVGMYTGAWYIEAHAGCRHPTGLVSEWLSGYPNAIVPCGAYDYNAHQFTDNPVDLSVFLGSEDQWRRFVNAGPSPAQVNGWIAARGSSLHAYYAHGCRQPVLTSGVCGQLAWRVDHFQKLIDTGHGYYPRCFGPRRNLGAAECQIVRPALAVWSRASASSQHWHNLAPARYFERRIAHTLATSRL